MGAHENLEHAEHAAHAGGHGAKHIGVTMGLLAVLIAFAAAMVGSERQELVTSLMDQSWAHSSYEAATVKFRSVMLELEKMRGNAKPAAAAEGGSLPRLLRLYAHYDSEVKLAQAWDDSCEPLIDTHYDAAESYEHGQLIAEVGVIIASIAILLMSRTAWIISIVVGVLCLAQVGYTYVTSHRAMTENHEKVHHAESAYEELMDKHFDSTEDEETVEALDPGGKIRKSIQEESAKEESAKPDEAKKPEESKH